MESNILKGKINRKGVDSMSNFSVDILQLRTSPYEIGKNLGKFIKNKPIYNVLQHVTKKEINVKKMENIFRNFAPHLIEQLQGISNTLQIPYEEACALFSGYDVPKTEAMGCTAFATKDYYVRNYDFSPDLYDGIFLLSQTKKCFATVGYTLQLLGLHDGVNEKGLTVGLHFVNNALYNEGVSAWLAVKIVLDSCSTTEEAIEVLKQLPHASCYNFSISDSNGAMAIVEATPKNVQIHEGNLQLICVNHFQNENMLHLNRKHIENSIQRKEHLLELSQRKWNQEMLFNYFRDPDSPLFFTDYKNLFGTLHTFSYNNQDSRILTTIANSDDVLNFKFNDWIAGENLKSDYLQGEIKE